MIIAMLLSHVMTLSRYLEQRFGRTTRLLASLAFSLQMTLYMGIVVYAPSLALSAVTGLSFTGSVISIGDNDDDDDDSDNESDNDNDPGVVCTFYSALGGMKAVLMTDVFQSLLMFAAIFSVISRIPTNYSKYLPPKCFQSVPALMPMALLRSFRLHGTGAG